MTIWKASILSFAILSLSMPGVAQDSLTGWYPDDAPVPEDPQGYWILDPPYKVEQQRNSCPTFFVNPAELFSYTMTATVKVTRESDDDLIGIAFGYHDPYNCYIMDWKKVGQQSTSGWGIRDEGFVLRKMHVNPPVPNGRYYWDNHSYDFSKYTILEQLVGPGTGWEYDTPYVFTLVYNQSHESTKYTVSVAHNGVPLFEYHAVDPMSISCPNPTQTSHFAFYCMSQPYIEFSNVVITEALCPNCDAGGPYTYSDAVMKFTAAEPEQGLNYYWYFDGASTAIEGSVVRHHPQNAAHDVMLCVSNADSTCTACCCADIIQLAYDVDYAPGEGPSYWPPGTWLPYPFPYRNLLASEAGYTNVAFLLGDGMIVAAGDTSNGLCNVPDPNMEFIACSVGGTHSLGLKSDGSIVAWGVNEMGQCIVSEPNEDYIGLAGGGAYSLGLKRDGMVVAWGDNSDGQCDVPAPNLGFVAIAAGDRHAMGLKADGTIVAWGDNSDGQCDVPAPNTEFVAVSSGERHSLGLKRDGSIVAWGNNSAGQCVVPPPNSGFVDLSGGGSHSLGLLQDGTVVAWGSNEFGQCDVPEPNVGYLSVEAGRDFSVFTRLADLTDTPVSDLVLTVDGFPNPFNPMTTIAYEVPASGPTLLQVFDLRGRQLKTLVDETLPTGRHEVRWDGRSDDGRELPSAMYLLRLQSGGRVAMGRMTLVR